MGDLPSGTVTFLFTDIVGSTRRWQDDPGMAGALARHDEILREAVASSGGHLLKHTGDGAVAVFAAAADGVRAAVEAQRRLQGAEWEGEPLRARMALHVGEAEERDGDYFGPALNVAARLMAAGHGGQILVSLPVEELVRDRMPAGTSLKDLGEHSFRDLDRPERVSQLEGDDLDGGFPPLSAMVTVPSNLPEPRTSFVGREGDLSGLVDLVRSGRLVTLVGVGGSGKTRLAVEVGRRLMHEEPERCSNGVYFADLSSLAEGTAITRTVSVAVGAPPAQGPTGSVGSGSAEDDVVGFLRRRRVLLVLDNCEHLLDDCAELVDRLLAEAPGLTVLATSREALAVEGEQSWQVRSLSLPDGDVVDDAEAMRLLVDRVRAVQPSFEVAPDNRDALVEICVRLDGIPLALELAAARVAHLAPAEIAERLGDRFKLLAGGRRRAQRQQTLQATVDWSYDLLDADEQVMLRRLAVFSAGFTLEAVEGICLEGIEGSAIDLLASFVDKSLVLTETIEGQTRYRLLETIRLYAEDKLMQAGEAERIRSAHRDWFLRRLEAEPWDRSLLSESLARELDRDYENLRAALDWCRAQDRPDLLRRLLLRMAALIPRHGRFVEAQGWFDQALEYEQTLPREEWFTHVMVEWIGIWRFSGMVAEVEASLTRLEPLLPELPEGSPSKALAALTHAILSMIHLEWATEMGRRADHAAEHAGDAYPLIRARSIWAKSIAYLYQQRYQDADALLAELRRSHDLGSAIETGYLDSTHGFARYLVGEYHDALQLLEVSLRHGGPWVTLRVGIAATAAAVGDAATAGRHLRETVASIRTAGWEHPLNRCDCLVGFAALAIHEGDLERASRLLAGIPGTSTPHLWMLHRHYVDLVRERLDRETRRRCIEEGRAIPVDEAIDRELARLDADETTSKSTPGS